MAVGELAQVEDASLTAAAIIDLKARLRGPLIAPGDPEYAAARQVYNGMIDRYPRLITRCRDVADVISAVNFGRETGLTVAVRGGGHNGGGLGTCDDGLVIDLSMMKGTRVDPVARTVRVEGGSTWASKLLFESVRRVAGGPVVDLVGPLPYPALQSMFDPLLPAGLQWCWRADFVDELSDAAIDVHIRHGSEIPTLLSQMHLYPINGAAGRVGKQDTAWSYRDATWGEVIVGLDPDPSNAVLIKDWAIAYWEAVHPYSAGGAYVNMMMDEGVERIKAAYRDNYDRLVAVKNRYDPKNLFHVNQNIRPTA